MGIVTEVKENVFSAKEFPVLVEYGGRENRIYLFLREEKSYKGIYPKEYVSGYEIYKETGEWIPPLMLKAQYRRFCKKFDGEIILRNKE